MHNLFHGWSGAWSSRINNDKQWIQVEFSAPFKITAIQTQGRSDCCDQWVKSYKLSYGNDGINWNNVNDGSGEELLRQISKIFNMQMIKFTQRCIILPGMTILWLQMFNGNTDKNTIVTKNINSSITSARFVRIRPQEWHEHTSLRFEILGCNSGNCKLKIGAV